MFRRLVPSLVSMVLAFMLHVPVAHAQTGAYRFGIARASDSTLVFALGAETWVRPGMKGIAVDARRHDALVATLRVLRVSGSEATALVTGQTTNMGVEYVVLMQRPRAPWYRQRAFWAGLLFGMASGFVGAQATH